MPVPGDRGTVGSVDSDALGPSQPPKPATGRGSRGPGSTAIRLLVAYSIALYVFPSNAVIGVVGASGYMASLVGLAAFALWAIASMVWHHHPLLYRNPIRIALALLWASSLISYALMHRYTHTPTVQLGSDRWLLQLAMISGVVLVAAEGLRSMSAIQTVVKAIIWGATFCGVVALLQFALQLDITPYLRMIPGFQENSEASPFQPRYGIYRVAGTALHPIELGVVSAMLLPLALWIGRFDKRYSYLRRWSPSAVLLAAATLSVSRSAVVALVVSLGLLMILLPVRDRAFGFILLPFALGAMFLGVPGFFRTMMDFFAAGANGTDSSIQARTDDYDFVADYVSSSPVFGQGPGAFERTGALQILDNQYLSTAMDFGLFGLFALVLYLGIPLVMSLSIRRRSIDPEMRWLCSALAAAAAVALVCTFTFDSFSFPMFVGTQCLVAALVGACWAVLPPRSSSQVNLGPLSGNETASAY
jgi:O-antigen ligase